MEPGNNQIRAKQLGCSEIEGKKGTQMIGASNDLKRGQLMRSKETRGGGATKRRENGGSLR